MTAFLRFTSLISRCKTVLDDDCSAHAGVEKVTGVGGRRQSAEGRKFESSRTRHCAFPEGRIKSNFTTLIVM